MANNLLFRLPSPPECKTGWPWTKCSDPLPEQMPDGKPWPKISIVTPSYNQAQYLEETIRSVLLQGYPNLEYIIIDGGSTDGSVEIIKEYEPWLTYWVSEKDKGQSHGINKGWELATGGIFSYLCSDDIYFDETLKIVAEKYTNNKNISIFTGMIASTDEHSRILHINKPFLQHQTPIDLTLIDHKYWFIPQSSSFFTKDILDKVGRFVREDLHYTMDRELIYRVVNRGRLMIIDKLFSTYRHHPYSKTTAEFFESYEENKKSFSYCQWGGIKVQKKRRKVLHSRLAKGYWLQGRHEFSFHNVNKYFIKAVLYKPSYLLQTSFIKSYIKKLINYENWKK